LTGAKNSHKFKFLYHQRGNGVTTSGLTFTDAAATRIGALIIKEGNYNLCLRVSIKGGGCSGFKYRFFLDEKIQADDQMTEKEITYPEGEKKLTVRVVIDPVSHIYLMGSEIDYIENLQGAYFTVKNPNAQTTCSCGSSFSI
jgi:iron-sulfur cluster insertion protein